MNPELVKAVGKYGFATVVAMYLIYFVTTTVVQKLDMNADYLRSIEKVIEHSNSIQEAMLDELEENTELHRLRYGLRISQPNNEVE